MLGARLNMSPVTTISFYRRTDLNDGTYLAETREGSLFTISRIVFFKAKKESIDIVGATSPKNYLVRPQIVELKPYKDALWVFSKTVGESTRMSRSLSHPGHQRISSKFTITPE